MKRQSVVSSNLSSIGYDAANEILEVEFNHGGIYHYFGVPEHVYHDLMNASSHGIYFSAKIKNDYEYQKL